MDYLGQEQQTFEQGLRETVERELRIFFEKFPGDTPDYLAYAGCQGVRKVMKKDNEVDTEVLKLVRAIIGKFTFWKMGANN